MNEDSGFDKVLRGEPVAVTDARLKEMQEQARHGALLNFYDPGHRHWHWLAALNELASLRAANQPSAMPEDEARCAQCGALLEMVRPGKWQHIGECPTDPTDGAT